ncbi:hypothetical protein [Actinosynnema sp. NPDC023587]|uniref:hypothetical protein n=1 Tax=Actinosynnema sp. NPDC023587 TaxID=3154695 RepID=UPI003409424E
MEDEQNRDRGKAVLAAIGLAADAAAVSVLLIVGGRNLVWALAVAGTAVGLVVLIRKWGQPINLVVGTAIVTTLLGAGVVGFAIGQARPTEVPVASGQTPDDTPMSENAKSTRLTTTTTTTAASAARGSSPVASAPAAPTTSRVLTSGSDSLAEVGGPIDLDEAGDHDIDVTDWSVDGLNGTQFVPAPPKAGDPTLAECAVIPAPQWRSSLALDEFREGGTFCVRTDKGHHGFLAIRNAELRGGEVAWVHSRWTVWE